MRCNFNRTTALNYAGTISGGGDVRHSGSGTSTLSGVNTYTGATYFSGGTISVGSTGALGTSGALIMQGGTLQYSAANTTDYSSRLNTGSTDYRIDTNGQAVTFASAVTGNGILTKLGDGTLTLTGSNNYLGGTVINGGSLQVTTLGSGNNLPNGNVSIASGADLTISSANTNVFSNFSGAGRVNLKGNNQPSQSSFFFLGSNSGFTGTIAVGPVGFGGRVRFSNARAFGSASVEISSGSGVQLGSLSYANNFKLNGNGWVENTGQFGALQLAGSGTVSGNVVLQSNSRIATTGSSNEISGPISGAFTLEKTGAGTLTLSGVQTYATLLASEGTTVLQSALGTGTSSLTANANVTLATSQKLASLSIGAGAVVTLAASAPFAPVADLEGADGESFGAPAVVPEPGSLSFLLVASLGLLGTRRARGAGR